MHPTTTTRAIAWLAGGGPAPGMNNNLRATVLAANAPSKMPLRVFGIPDGYRCILSGDIDAVRPLSPEDVAHIGSVGACILGMKRDTFDKDPSTRDRQLRAAVDFLRALERRHNVQFVQVNGAGGDDTLYSLAKLAKALKDAGMEIDVVHHGKTIDKDYRHLGGSDCVPWEWAPEIRIPGPLTFGYSTVCEIWHHAVLSKCLDANNAGGVWHLDQLMGRYSGWLVHGTVQLVRTRLERMAREIPRFRCEPPLAIMPEMFAGRSLSLDELASICAEGIRRRAEKQSNGSLLVSEGIIQLLDADSKARLLGFKDAGSCPHGHLELEAFGLLGPLGDLILEKLSTSCPKVKKIRTGGKWGYDARSQAPNQFDLAFTTAIAERAVERAREGLTGQVSLCYDGRVSEQPFSELIGVNGKVARHDMPEELAAEYWLPFTGVAQSPWKAAA